MEPLNSAPNRSKGLLCPACFAPISGRIPPAVKKRVRKRTGKKAQYVRSVRHRDGEDSRVRQCLKCGNRCLTREVIVSNRV